MSRDAAWTAFDQAAAEAASARIVDQFAADPDRLARFARNGFDRRTKG